LRRMNATATYGTTLPAASDVLTNGMRRAS
jgi:hypothetical protein